jgi:hypothetical protein
VSNFGGGTTTLFGLLILEFLALLESESEKLSIFRFSFLAVGNSAVLSGQQSTLALKADRGDQTLDLWSLGLRLLVALGRELSADDKLSDVVLLAESEHLADLGSSLWSQSLWHSRVGQAWQFSITLLGDDQGEDSHVWSNDATADGLALAFTSAARSVARVTLAEEETDTVWNQHTLLHRETLLVVTTSDLEYVALEFVSDGVSLNFSGHSLVIEDTPMHARNVS